MLSKSGMTSSVRSGKNLTRSSSRLTHLHGSLMSPSSKTKNHALTQSSTLPTQRPKLSCSVSSQSLKSTGATSSSTLISLWTTASRTQLRTWLMWSNYSRFTKSNSRPVCPAVLTSVSCNWTRRQSRQSCNQHPKSLTTRLRSWYLTSPRKELMILKSGFKTQSIFWGSQSPTLRSSLFSKATLPQSIINSNLCAIKLTCLDNSTWCFLITHSTSPRRKTWPTTRRLFLKSPPSINWFQTCNNRKNKNQRSLRKPSTVSFPSLTVLLTTWRAKQ